jgi:NAD(P)-dependent dehydrogenase (short-subunit alcohol dehydrogenase family)
VEILDRTFLVTGGASGLGEATADRLVGGGANVVLADVNAARGEALSARLGARAMFVCVDVTEPSELHVAVERALQRHGRIDGAVSCAGIGLVNRLVERDGVHSLVEFERVIRVNLVGTFNLVVAVAKVMADASDSTSSEHGVIVTTASIAAFDGQIGQVAYAASKAGVAGMTLPLARELGRYGVRVVTIAPGVFDTPLMQIVPADVRASLSTQVPFPRRFGRPSEFAALVTHVIQNEMLNGEIIRLDGALRMAAR